MELSGESERERTAAGEEQPLAGRDPLHLDDRLGARRQSARRAASSPGRRPGRSWAPGASRTRPRRDRARSLALGDEHRLGAAQRDAARSEQQRRAGCLGRVDQRPSAPVIPRRARGVPHRQPGLLEDLPAERRPLVDERDRARARRPRRRPRARQARPRRRAGRTRLLIARAAGRPVARRRPGARVSGPPRPVDALAVRHRRQRRALGLLVDLGELRRSPGRCR